MSLTCGFFNSEDGDREYFNQDLSNFLEGLITDGIYEFIDDHMMITASETPDMYINIGKGRAWFNATWTKIDATVRQGIPAADAVLNRIDAICLTVNKTRAVRNNYIEIISGTGAAGTPTKPTVADETDIYRHVLAYVTVPKGATAITQAQIENRIGMGSALFSAPKWGNVPTTEEMVAQWQTQFDEFMDHIHQTFDYDAAGNLQVGIDNLAPAYDSGETYVEGDFVLDANVLKKLVEGVFTPKLVSEEIKDMKSAFQAGVDAVYNAVVAEGVTPASSTPEDIATAIATIRNGGNATAADIVAGKTALSGKRLLTGTRKQTETYTFPANDTGGTKDLGEQNLYRYVNAANVYNKGYATPRTWWDMGSVTVISATWTNQATYTLQIQCNYVGYYIGFVALGYNQSTQATLTISSITTITGSISVLTNQGAGSLYGSQLIGGMFLIKCNTAGSRFQITGNIHPIDKTTGKKAFLYQIGGLTPR